MALTHINVTSITGERVTIQMPEFSEEYSYNGDIKDALINLLFPYALSHSKTLVVRFDLEFPQSIQMDLKQTFVSKLMAKLIQKYKRQKLDPRYLWAREQKQSTNPHFHCVLLLNGQKVQSPYRVFNDVTALWSSTLGVDATGLVNYCLKSKDGTKHENGIMIRKHEPNFDQRLQDVVRQVSYIAKNQDKGSINDCVRNFGCSSISKYTPKQMQIV